MDDDAVDVDEPDYRFAAYILVALSAVLMILPARLVIN